MAINHYRTIVRCCPTSLAKGQDVGFYFILIQHSYLEGMLRACQYDVKNVGQNIKGKTDGECFLIGKLRFYCSYK